ncbi:hypothetical protein [Pseudobacteriovorax antillogorgiicola]|uniref:MAPEG family protein n=1 Tax=Pseudobacteriovorax antillogorgiicola TaxID=1513793 RepID=A0A1Y6CWS8_9BACT|nr:hypothetical protein [Pseudobacteriovorax antillogorgiicola]TCS40913.1 hypothetical protein EDD56_15212 [Pseudobacteriovorax antillogorgiicola]SMF84075.1 hypothetical protein SAMN06296036_1522 [Pseudobacteriovorax antillogorgiicola]
MNFVLIFASFLSGLAFLAHAFIGDKEYRALKPGSEEDAKPMETWIQTRCGWHWVSLDLLAVSVLLFVLASTQIIQAKTEILHLLSLYHLACGCVWLLTLLFSKSHNRQIFVLGQWIFCFIQASLIYWGA